MQAIQRSLRPAISGNSIHILSIPPSSILTVTACVHTCSCGVENVMWSLKSSAWSASAIQGVSSVTWPRTSRTCHKHHTAAAMQPIATCGACIMGESVLCQVQPTLKTTLAHKLSRCHRVSIDLDLEQGHSSSLRNGFCVSDSTDRVGLVRSLRVSDGTAHANLGFSLSPCAILAV